MAAITGSSSSESAAGACDSVQGVSSLVCEEGCLNDGLSHAFSPQCGIGHRDHADLADLTETEDENRSTRDPLVERHAEAHVSRGVR